MCVHRVDEMAAKIAASAEAAENGGPPENGASHAINENDGGDRMLEDEGIPSSSTSSIGQQQSPIWEIEDSDAPPCIELALPPQAVYECCKILWNCCIVV